MSEPLELRRRIREAGRTLAYLVAGLPLGVLGALAALAAAVGAALSVIWIGIPLLAVALAAGSALADTERRLANALLETHLARLPPRTAPWQRSLGLLAERQQRRVLVLLATRLVVAIALLAAAGVLIALAGWLLVLGLQGITGLGGVDAVGPLSLGVPAGVLLCLLALPVAVLAIAVLGAEHGALRAIVRSLLAPPTAQEGPVREILAESLGDRTLSIAYWLPDREVFVDDTGRPVALPEPGSGRAWTAVERDGRRVAAIVHDAGLDAGPDLVNAAAAAAALAIDNERLKADLRARVVDLRVSRARIVEAADAARRRLERDLHDGAQQQLVSLALDLRILRSRLGQPDAAQLVDEIGEKLATALAELRELARGIHPAILTDRGLAPAIAGLGDRMPVPVEIRVELEERLPAPIEAAAYFVVAEALTNVAKYARATGATVDLRRAGEELVVAVEDDGVGGARAGAGSGLRGMEDRVAALDGSLTVDSPPGDGTRLRARIPCGPAPEPERREPVRAMEPRR